MNTKEEAAAKGIPLSPPKNDKHRRAPWHDYSRPGLYMLTLVTRDREPLLGKLIIYPRPKVELSGLGRAILTDEIRKIHNIYNNVEVWKTCIMPDHMHFIVNVTDAYAENKNLGTVVSGFKVGCNKAYRRLMGIESGSMFEPRYNDRIILPGMQYERWKAYLDDNPRRLAMKKAYPEYFTTLYSSTIGDVGCYVFGNLYLLEIPDKMEVIVHRKDTEEVYRDKYKQWMACGERGGVLVSAAIAPRERAVINEAKDRGYNVIELCDNGFGPFYKPSGRNFDACAMGHLLQVSPWEYRAERVKINRTQCLDLNNLAIQICTQT